MDMSGANRLLYYRDLKVATLDLAGASSAAVHELLAGRAVRAGRLFPDPLQLPMVVKTLKAIDKPARVYAEEFGQVVTHHASGFATWTRGDQKAPNAPVLLRHVNFQAIPGSSDAFELTASDEVLINPVLRHALEAEHGVVIDDSDLLERFGDDDLALFEQLTKLAAQRVEGFIITARSVIANFAYASQPMVQDLDNEELVFLAGNDMVAALAGDQEATQAVVSAGNQVSLETPDHNDPTDEHLILDADGSQSYVINAIVAGQHLVVQGPPGTGKTQTIANTIAELVARGQTVLFVAQKRAAITAVLSRLEDAGLGDLVLDLFDGANSRKRVVQDIGRRLESLRSTPRPNADALQGTYVQARDLLVSHREAMHEIRPPWGMSLLGAKVDGQCVDGFYDWTLYAEAQTTQVRLAISDLQSWDASTHDQLRRGLRELASRDALNLEFHTRPGWKPSAIANTAVLQAAEAAAERLRSTSVPQLDQNVGDLATTLQVPFPATLNVAWADKLTQHLAGINQGYHAGLAPALSQTALTDELLTQWIYATGGKDFRKQHPQELGLFARRKIRKALTSVLPERTLPEHHDVLQQVRQTRASWLQFSGQPIPAAPDPLWDQVGTSVRTVRADLDVLRVATQAVDLDDIEVLPSNLGRLLSDRSRNALPRMHELEQLLIHHGCQPLLDDLRQHPAGDQEWDAADRLSYSYCRTVIEHLDRTDPRLTGLEATDLNRATSDFQQADTTLRQANASRVRRSAAEALVQALDTHPDQAERIRGQVKRKRGFLPIRALVSDVAPDVVLAAKPVWAASPQAVSQLLPSRQLFDIVLFDEASQVLPAAAIPSIARAAQLVVAGDDLQLPPTTIFTRTSELGDAEVNLDEFEPDDEEDPTAATPERGEAPDTESILDAVAVKLGTQRSRYLAWHYRSRDERLIATSNEFLYRPNGRTMTTFPASNSAGALRLEQCPPSTGLGKTNLSPAAEVHKVVDLMLEHARAQVGAEKPQSLGVIAFGQKHSARIEREFEQRLLDETSEVKAYFADTGNEKYFIKNIERVQGDERDLIILTVGYGKGVNGKLSYNWGPVQQTGGHRRVNVAISRAKSQMILVTSFGPDDVDPTYSQAEGFQLMRRFIEYAASGGQSFGDEGAQHVPCNPFEADIQRRLEAAGLTVIPQWGVGGYRIDFAIQHPTEPGRFVLAIEADGASYHSGTIARERDRLRQQLLEARGWTFVRIWSSDYFFAPDPEIQRVVNAYQEALTTSPRTVSTQRAARTNTPAAIEPTPEDVPTWQDTTGRRRGRPRLSPGEPISSYSDHELRRIVTWIISDDAPRTRVEIYEETKTALGFQRNGKTIAERLNAAIDVILAAR